MVVLAASLFYIYWRGRHSEGYETIMDKVQDRANPLAAPIHPLKNPNAKYGISESSGADLRGLNLTALNTGLDMRNSNQDLTIGKRIVRLSPRIDNENSFLGMVKFCKDIVDESAKASPPSNPFNNPTFKKHCGVCTGSGSLITGDTFNRLSNNGRGTGILVYEEDKNRAMERQTRNNYKYPRAIPSLDAAQCSGASLNDDSEVPVLAINSQMYYDMLTRLDCINNKIFKDDRTCGRCVSGGTENAWSYVKNPSGQTVNNFESGLSYDTSAAVNPIFLDLYGVGKVKVTVAGREILGSDNKVIGSVTLNLNTPKTWDLSKTSLGYAKEGEKFVIELDAIDNGFAYVGGMVRGNAPPDSVESKLQLANVYIKDIVSGGRTARGSSIATTKDTIITFVPSTQPGDTKRANPVLKMECFIPLTFISSSWDNDHPQIAYYDCLNNPYITSGDSEAFLTDDVCIRDKLLKQDLSVECLQKLLSEIGCSSAGSWWRNTSTLTTDATSKDVDGIRAYLTRVFPTADTNQTINMKCFGLDTSNACDDYLETNKEPSAECLKQLYSNQITENRRLSSTKKQVYSTELFVDYPQNYRSLNKNTDEFCRPGAGLDPTTSAGLSKLKGISNNGYGGVKGVDAVKKYLTDTYDRAVNSSLDIHSDGDKGRKQAWMNCFGIPIAAPKEITKIEYEPDTAGSTPTDTDTVGPCEVRVYYEINYGSRAGYPAYTTYSVGDFQYPHGAPAGYFTAGSKTFLAPGNNQTGYNDAIRSIRVGSGVTATVWSNSMWLGGETYTINSDTPDLGAWKNTISSIRVIIKPGGLCATPAVVIPAVVTPANTGKPVGRGSWHGFASSSDGTKLLTGDEANGYIYTSTDSGLTWTQRTGAGTGQWNGFASSADGTKLVTGNRNYGYIFTSADSGATWIKRDEGIAAPPKYLLPGAAQPKYGKTFDVVGDIADKGRGMWYGFASSADGPKLVTGGFRDYLYTSWDSGATWIKRTRIGGGYLYGFASSADGSKLFTGSFGDYLSTSTDSGATWTQRTGAGRGWWYGFASSADGTKLVTGDCIHGDGTGGYIYTSTDSGATWIKRTGAGRGYWLGFASSSDGTKLLTGDYYGIISISADSGATWIKRNPAYSSSRPDIGATPGVASSADGSKLVTGTSMNGDGTGGIMYTSTDSGVTWRASV